MKLRTPYKNILPVLSTEELDALKERISSEGGIHDPILITETGEILDGHNRYSINKFAPTQKNFALVDSVWLIPVILRCRM